MDMRFGTWNVKGLYRTDSLKTAARELAKWHYKRSDGLRVIISQQKIIHFSMEMGMLNFT
jgi:hypothetical protein